ncbi:hypothetical protein GIB67_001191 [Kingdonia uniflora]|uniref:SWIM-type domain-containing protein n=1 Tax=Kingdonia uniflora TaxID=39325 RepID=A0A7J7LGI0_9MAGN|nr:hypothetical protein GIB67_001191 [Kingdonia uniflora]
MMSGSSLVEFRLIDAVFKYRGMGDDGVEIGILKVLIPDVRLNCVLVRGMNGVQLYTVVHFGGDIVRPKIGSILSYVGGSTKLTSLRAHSSYEDFVTLLEEISEIRREDYKLYNFGKGLSTTKDTGSGKGLSTTKAGGPLRHNSFPYPEPEYKGCPKTNSRGFDPRRFRPLVDDNDVPQSNDYLKTIRTDVPPSNKLSISQSNVHLSNKPVLTNVPQSNEFFQTIPTNVSFSNEPCISQSNIHLSNEPVLTNVPLSNELIYGVAYTNHVESYNNVILKVRDLPIHVFIKELLKICLKMSYTYKEEAEKSQARLTLWVTNHCESKKFMADLLTCRVRTSRYHFQMTSYGRTDYVNIEYGTCSCRWWQMMGIPCEHRVRILGLANVDRTTCVFEYFTNDIYKVVYEPIWIPIRGIEQWKILKTDPRVRAPIPTVRAGRPRT